MEWAIGIALVAGLVAVRHVAMRRVARGDRRFLWLFFAPTVAVPAFVVWIALGMWGREPIMAVGLALVFGVSLALVAGMLRGMANGDGARLALGNCRDHSSTTSSGRRLGRRCSSSRCSLYCS